MLLLKEPVKFFLCLRVSLAEGIFGCRGASGVGRWCHTCCETSRSRQVWARTWSCSGTAIVYYAAYFFSRHWENWSNCSICHRSVGLSLFSLIRVNEVLTHSFPLFELMISFRQKSLQIVTVTHQSMFGDFYQEPMQALLPLQDLLWLVVVPVDQGVFRGDRRDNAGGEAALKDLK